MIRTLVGAMLLLGTTTATAPTTAPVSVDKQSAPEKALVFTVTVPAPVDAVWEVLATTAGLETWLSARCPRRAAPRRRLAGALPGRQERRRQRARVRGQAPPRAARHSPEWFPHVRSEGTRAVFELAPEGEGSTRVTLRQTGWKEGKEWDDAYQYLAKGNAQLLTQLRDRFVSGPRQWSDAAH